VTSTLTITAFSKEMSYFLGSLSLTFHQSGPLTSMEYFMEGWTICKSWPTGPSNFVAPAAAMTAPHFSWPMMRRSGVLRCATPYSILPSVAGSMTLPATRITNNNPIPSPKIISGDTRESEHVKIVANGKEEAEKVYEAFKEAKAHSTGVKKTHFTYTAHVVGEGVYESSKYQMHDHKGTIIILAAENDEDWAKVHEEYNSYKTKKGECPKTKMIVASSKKELAEKFGAEAKAHGVVDLSAGVDAFLEVRTKLVESIPSLHEQV